MSDHDEFVLEVRSSWAGEDPPIQIFRAELQCGHGTWSESFGSVEQLEAYLKGAKSVFGSMGYGAMLLDWGIPPQWKEPSGRRWFITRHGLPRVEDLNSAGEVIAAM